MPCPFHALAKLAERLMFVAVLLAATQSTGFDDDPLASPRTTSPWA
jgi:hypothetical protein